MAIERELDVVVFGATGFVGRLTAEQLAQSAPESVRIGLAGRSRERLEEVRSSLGPRAAEWSLVPADTNDRASLVEMAQRTRVLATTVGPYRRYGMPVVEACVEAGTDYADLTGELPFIRETIDRFHDTAAERGTRIVHACGFDSVPSDLGVLLLHEAARADDAGELEDTIGVVTSMRGGLSGGTLASMKGIVDDVRSDPGLRRLMLDPYALSPDRDREPRLGGERDPMRPHRIPEIDGWVAPFVMAPFNTRIVRRSNALRDWAYGRSFRYREGIATGSGPLGPVRAAAVAGGTGAVVAGLALPPTRKLLDRFLPSPGEGPSEKTRRSGHFTFDFHARTSDGRRYTARVAAQGDPGYAATSVMLAQSALCLALDADRPPDTAGILTPATAMGAALADRLRAAGHTLEAAPRR